MRPDIVIPVRPGENNQSLRYTLRSIAAHVPHRRVWIAGHKPAWVRGVGHIPNRQTATKYQNSRSNWKAAVDHPDVTDDFLIFNDDFFVMRPFPPVPPVLHRGPLAAVEEHFRTRVRPGRYMLGMRQTAELLADLGIDDPLCYEMHTPMLLNRQRYLEVWELGNRIKYPHSRTLYGNYWKLGGKKAVDPKIMSFGPRFPHSSLFLSTMNETFTRGQVGSYIRSMFPQRCRYEAAPQRGEPRLAAHRAAGSTPPRRVTGRRPVRRRV